MHYVLFLCRSFTDPHPTERETLNAVSSLTCSIICSLKLGTIRRCSFNVCVRRDVFKFLFGDTGSRVSRRRGRMFNRCDFNDRFFNDSDFVYYNNHNECIRVVFPIYLYSYVKFIKLSSIRYDFCETVCVNIIKEHC